MSMLIDQLEQEEATIDFERSYTLEEFLNLPFEDGYDYELLIGGRILATSRDPGPGAPHGEAASRIFNTLFNYVSQDAARGWVWADTSVQIQATSKYVKPDITYLPAANITTQYTGPITDLPALVIEINSPSDKVKDIEDKLATYTEAGIPLIWSVYPAKQFIHVWKLGASKPEVYGREDTLTAEEVLPGFSLSCAAIFARYQPINAD